VHIGFTGTSRGKGMTAAQTDAVFFLLCELKPTEFHHGVCVGADAQAHRLALGLKTPIIGHPPVQQDRMATLTGFARLCEPQPYLKRNRDIVVAGRDGIIAAPRDFIEPANKRGEGTWTTVGYARQAKRTLWIVYPDGTFKKEVPR